MEYLTLKEYEKIARKILNKSFPKIAKFIMCDSEKFGKVVSELVIADWKFDNRGTIEGYRKQRICWIISNLLSKEEKTVYLEENKFRNISLPNKMFEEIDLNESLNLLHDKIKKENNLSQREQMCVEGYFIQKLDLESLAESLGIRKQSVKNNIRKAISKLGVYDEHIERFRQRKQRRKPRNRTVKSTGI